MVWFKSLSTEILDATGVTPSAACRFRQGGAWCIVCAKVKGLVQVYRAQKANAAPKGAVIPDMQNPQDMVKVFAETQKNMMKLNR